MIPPAPPARLPVAPPTAATRPASPSPTGGAPRGERAPPSGDGEPGDGEPGNETFETLAQRHAAVVYRIAHRITGSDADAQEVRQQIFLQALRDPPAGVADWRAWLCRCAANAAANHLRTAARRRNRHRRAPGPTPAPDPLAAAEARDEAARLRAAMNELTADQRAVLALRFDGGLTLSEVAAHLGVPVGTAKDRSRTAIARLRALLTAPGTPR